ncbi:MAG: gfo/Idh/MocA family oxidoreductase, partial [Pirellulales bacterium]|nr:gfo/Idh/MocA family oxidoreductase [Pirellulales bacterium]
NNSYRLGTEAPFDAKAASFGDDHEVGAHFEKLHAIMQDGVGVPADATSYRLGPWLSFDAETERFTGERAAEANQLLEDPHTAAFQVPKPDDV